MVSGAASESAVAAKGVASTVLLVSERESVVGVGIFTDAGDAV